MLNTHRHKWIVPLLNMVFFAIVLWGGWQYLTSGVKSTSMPGLSGTVLNPKAESYQRGKVHLIFFWKKGCNGCDSMLSSIKEIAKDYPVIAVASDETGQDASIRQYLSDNQVNFPVVLDSSGINFDDYQVESPPACFIFDAKGRLVFVEKSYVSGAGMRFRLWLAGMI